jgi:hypothetical protein
LAEFFRFIERSEIIFGGEIAGRNKMVVPVQKTEFVLKHSRLHRNEREHGQRFKTCPGCLSNANAHYVAGDGKHYHIRLKLPRIYFLPYLRQQKRVSRALSNHNFGSPATFGGVLDNLCESATHCACGYLGGSMQEYEIRILSGGETHSIVAEVHLSDVAAIRAGKKYAVDNPFEVWRDVQCVYRKLSAGRRSRS